MTYFSSITDSKKIKQIVIVSFFILSAMIWLGFRIYHHYFISTDDAYVNANIVQIAPRITGKIVTVYVKDNEHVKKGQALFDIDPEPFQVAVDSAKAQVEISLAQWQKASLSAKRTFSLVKTQFVSTQEGDNALSNLKTAAGNVDYAKAALSQALLNLQYAKIIAPANGWVTHVSLRAGDIVTANQPLFALISDDEFWVDANYKETELENIQYGQCSRIITDLYPNHVFHGIVESISSGTGTVFSLLPPQNATGNWVKVTQRVPVRIHIQNPDPAYPLRVGISATATIALQQNKRKSNAC